ncbi:hypothetical protein FJT64_019498 [Amphibalanus amphitrite]|uniref:DUF4789 domain-containing protein n=1 Tax=Amphibalanus amphitrite TaxID=1232801 RepID=A0A6A4WRH7_AMPAM|nr:hypothetical protein FJT64_019498 [Amphibalanus amphitrite]
MAGRAVLPQLVLLVLVLGCSVDAMPRSGGPILFVEDQLGAVFRRFPTRTTRTSVSSRRGSGDQERRDGLGFSPRFRRLERLEVPPPPRRSITEETKPARRAFAGRRRSTVSSSAIIFPGQEGHELPWAPRTTTTTERTVAEPVPENPVEGRTDTTLANLVETRDEMTLKISPEKKQEGAQEKELPVVPECDGVQFYARDPSTGKCRPLAMRSGCPSGEWFVLDRETRVAACRPYPCPLGQAMLDGACQNLSDSRSVCAPGMVLQVNEFGDAWCDCRKGRVFWPAEQRCYMAYLRGPCAEGQQLSVDAEGAVCVTNPCGRDGWARWPETGRCHPLFDTSDAPCPHGRMEVEPATLRLVCNDVVANSVFSTPSVPCAVGSRRSQGGRCKRTIRTGGGALTFRRGPCSPGFVEAPDGGCRREIRPGPSFLG